MYRQEESQTVCSVQRFMVAVPFVLLGMGTAHWTFHQEMKLT